MKATRKKKHRVREVLRGRARKSVSSVTIPTSSAQHRVPENCKTEYGGVSEKP